jgi:predicted O-methyltransferase YrrM
VNLKSIAERADLVARKRLIMPRQIVNIRASVHRSVRGVGEALDALRNESPTSEEARWFTVIENLRGQLSHSTDVIEVLDYGAGNSGKPLAENQILHGQIVKEVVGEACRNYSKSPIWSRLLFHLIRTSRPANCLELGTCLGMSAAYQGAALEVNGNGKIVTLEGAPSFASIAEHNLRSLGLAQRVSVVVGRFQDTLLGVLDDFGKIDYAFIDGHHDEKATIRYFEMILPYLSDSAMLIFDDIGWSPGMIRAWYYICNHSRMDAGFDLKKMGVCLFGVGVKIQYKVVVA